MLAQRRSTGAGRPSCSAACSGCRSSAMPLAAALAHFILEERFNRALLFDLVKRPARSGCPRPPDMNVSPSSPTTTSTRSTASRRRCSAVLRQRPPDIRLRIYTAARLHGSTTPDYLALRSLGVPIPFYGEMRMYVPRVARVRRRARGPIGIDVIHLTTPGPVGPGGDVCRAGGSAADGRQLSHRSGGLHRAAQWIAAARRADARVHALAVRPLRARAGAVASHARAVHQAKGDPRRIEIWPRGVDTHAVSIRTRRSERAARRWHVADNRPALALRRTRLAREGPRRAAGAQPRCTARASSTGSSSSATDRCSTELRREMPDAVFTGVLDRATAWLRRLPRPTSSCSRAAPIPPATSCSRRRRAACRLSCPTPAGRARTWCRRRPGSSCHQSRRRRVGQASLRLLRDARAVRRWRARRATTPLSTAMGRRCSPSTGPIARSRSPATEAHPAPPIPASGCAS